MSTLTKDAIVESLKILMRKKPLTKITISDITENCGISRMTFYYHFQDIYDLMEWACIKDARKALDHKNTYDTWDEGYLHIFEVVYENKIFIMNAFECVNREQVEKYLYELTYNLLINVVEEKSEGLSVREEDKRFIAEFYKYGFVGLILDWISNGMKEKPEDIIEQLKKLIQGNFEKALEIYSEE